MQQAIMKLKQKCPGLIGALNMLKYKASVEMDTAISTDGEYLYYHPQTICNIRRCMGYAEIMRDILHILCHGMFGHFDIQVLYRDRKLMWVAMDREVEHYVDLLMGEKLERNRYMDEYLGQDYSLDCYYKARTNKAIRKKMLMDKDDVKRDDHRWWLNSKQKNSQGDLKKGDYVFVTLPKDKFDKIRQAWKKMALSLTDGGKMDIRGALLYMGKDKGSFGDESLGVAETIKAAAPNHNSYYDILMEYLKPNEVTKEEPDSIDPMLYYHGLDMYGDVPLIEPIENSQLQKLNTICIAIDTSGSCLDEVAESFLRETGNVLRDLQNYSGEGEVYVWTCDCELKQEMYYASLEEVDLRKWEEMDLYGWGGTSFVPVFDRIDQLIEENKKIDCLIYLTDACGDYPYKIPDYPVCFVLPEEYKDEETPDWIRKIILEEKNG